MNNKIKVLFISLFLTIIFMITLDVFTTTILPIIGLDRFRFSFNGLFVFFLALKIGTAFLPVFILMIHLFHGAFTVEGWAFGTFIGVLLSHLVERLKGIIHLSGPTTIIFTTFIFQFLWFFIATLIHLFQVNTPFSFLRDLEIFLVEGTVLSILSPIIYKILDKVWKNYLTAKAQ